MNELLIHMLLDGFSFRRSIELDLVTVSRGEFSVTFEVSQLNLATLTNVLQRYGAFIA
jgi:hypothetical protein